MSDIGEALLSLTNAQAAMDRRLSAAELVRAAVRHGTTTICDRGGALPMLRTSIAACNLAAVKRAVTIELAVTPSRLAEFASGLHFREQVIQAGTTSMLVRPQGTPSIKLDRGARRDAVAGELIITQMLELVRDRLPSRVYNLDVPVVVVIPRLGNDLKLVLSGAPAFSDPTTGDSADPIAQAPINVRPTLRAALIEALATSLSSANIAIGRHMPRVPGASFDAVGYTATAEHLSIISGGRNRNREPARLLTRVASSTGLTIQLHSELLRPLIDAEARRTLPPENNAHLESLRCKEGAAEIILGGSYYGKKDIPASPDVEVWGTFRVTYACVAAPHNSTRELKVDLSLTAQELNFSRIRKPFYLTGGCVRSESRKEFDTRLNPYKKMTVRLASLSGGSPAVRWRFVPFGIRLDVA